MTKSEKKRNRKPSQKRKESAVFLAGIADRMREMMAGETQVSLAAKLQVSQGNIAKFLQGKILPRGDVLWRMMQAKNINPTWFLTGKGPTNLGRSYKAVKRPPLKAAAKKRIPYGVDKGLKTIEKRLEKLALTSPETLNEIRLFLNAVEQSSRLRTKRD